MAVPPLSAVVEEARRAHRVPAIGAALVGADGAREVAVAGTRIRGRDLPVAADDPWHIGSCTKAMTAFLYARLVEAGHAAWGARLVELMPDLAGAAHPGWAGITIDDVLRHRAGLPANPSPGVLRRAAHDPRPVRDARTEMAAEALARPPREPGRFRYSNVGYLVAGAAIERIADRTWEEALAAEVLEPLGITTAGVGAPRGDAPRGHRPLIGGMGRGPAVDPDDPVLSDNPPVAGPAGRVHLSLADWGRFVAQSLEGGATLLREDTLAHLLAPGEGPGPPHAMGWALPQGRAARELGAEVAFGHQGSNRRWVAAALVSADRRRAALVATNDGRARLIPATTRLAARLLAG